MASQDPECKLVNAGAWYSMTGYAIAFPRNSRYYDKFNMKMLEYRKNGELTFITAFARVPDELTDDNASQKSFLNQLLPHIYANFLSG